LLLILDSTAVWGECIRMVFVQVYWIVFSFCYALFSYTTSCK